MKELLELRSIQKLYPGVVALNDISIKINQGEVHALLGENGAGKSTLIKVLAGAIEPNGGEIVFEGKSYTHMTPILAQQLGIGVIYQEFNLVPSLTISENIFLGNELRNGILINKNKMIQESKKLLKSLEIEIDPTTLVRELSVAFQQIVEIAKAVSRNVKLLIMDEPTAPLTNHEIEAMFKLVRKLVEKNVTIIYISHRLEELFEIADRVTVLRDGAYIATKTINETTKDELVNLMVGRPLTEQYPKRHSELGEIVLDVKNIYAGPLLHDVSFQVRAGEVVGFSGLIGAGRTELMRVIFGADEKKSGEITLYGKKINCTSPAEAISKGIALIPEDRKLQGVLLKMSVSNNITLTSIRRLSKFSILNNKKEQKIVNTYIDKLRIKTPGSQQLVKNLSGGNQQKIVLAKWLASNCKVFLFDEPTRGIDVGAKFEIYQLINELAGQGYAVVIVSSELPEIIGMSDRIIVMNDGCIVGELSKDECTQQKIMNLASGRLVV